MRRTTAIALVIAGGTCAVIILAGCASSGHRRWLNVFFDGVPDPSTQKQTASGPALAATNAAGAKPGLPGPLPPPQVVYFNHKPYAQDNCLACHQSRFSVEMKGTMKQVCFDCHKDMVPAVAPKSSHQPFTDGDCASCHNPHYSTNKFLLVKTAKTLCADCHDPVVAKPKSIHQPYQDNDCFSCHTAHTSTNKFLVARAEKALCFDCHDDFLAKAKFKHDPAGNGECSSCHNPHASVNNALLTKEPQKLCFDCHEEKDVAAAKGHAKMGKAACLDCHDPHVGADEYLLKVAKVAAKPPGSPP